MINIENRQKVTKPWVNECLMIFKNEAGRIRKEILNEAMMKKSDSSCFSKRKRKKKLKQLQYALETLKSCAFTPEEMSEYQDLQKSFDDAFGELFLDCI